MAFRSPVYDEVKERVSLADYAADVLEVRNRYHNGDPCQCVCPVCGSGSGPKGTAALTLNPNDPKRWHCFSHGEGGDIYDLAGAVNGTDKADEQLAIVAEWAGLDLDGLRRPSLAARMQNSFMRQQRQEERRRKAEELQAVWKANRKAEAERLHQLMQEPLSDKALAYLSERGIDEATAERWRIGYDAKAKRIVIPYPGSDYYHADRDITGSAYRNRYDKPKMADVGPEPMWNPGALDSEFIVMVEGQLDALAVADLGFEAVACGGVGTAPTLKAMRERGGYDGSVLLMFDNDKAGREASARALSQLTEPSITVFHDWPEVIKDPFEWWQCDPDKLKAAIQKEVR